MSYKELKGLYYSDESTYTTEYLKRFNSSEAQKTDFFIGNNQAFFLQNSEVMTLAYQIAKLDKSIYKLCCSLPGIAIEQYSKRCLIDEIVITNKIEGVHSSRKEIGDVLDILETQSKNKNKQHRFLGLVNKYLKLIKNEPITLTSCNDIRIIYDEIFLDEVVRENPANKPDGKFFRKESVSVHSETDKVIHNGITPESKIIESMEKALSFLNNSSIDELLKICVFHYFIEYIHPFYDGNGRLGRFILSYGISNILSPMVAFKISETIKENINAYYKAFRICNDPHNLGDITPFVLMMLDMIYKSMHELHKSLWEKDVVLDKYITAIGKYYTTDKALMNIYSLLIQAALFSEKGILMDELKKYSSMSVYTIKNYIEKIPENLLIVKKQSYFKYYSLNLQNLDDVIFKNNIAELTNT